MSPADDSPPGTMVEGPPASTDDGSPSMQTRDQAVRSHPAPTWLAVGAGYLALSVVLWWNVWSGHPTSTTTCGCGDSSLFTWFLAWPAFAISHGLDPLHSTATAYPGGVDLLSNTSELAIGTLLAPITWLFGPIATLNVALTLAPVLSGLAMFGLLRRWVSWTPAAVVGGLFYGFSPFIVGSVTGAYLMTGLAVLPPLIVAGLDELLIRQRRSPTRTGILLGLLVALQFFIGTELLVIVVVTGLIGVALVVGYAALRHRQTLRERAAHAAKGLALAAVTVAVLLAYPTWFALAGPSHLAEPIWPGLDLHAIGTVLRNFFVPPPAATGATALNRVFGGYQGPTLSNQYFGFGITVVLLAGTIIWRRDRRLWLFGSVGLIAAVLSLRVGAGSLLPWGWVDGLPLLENVIPGRFVLVTYLASAVMVGVIVDHAHAAVLGSETAPSWVAGRPERPRPPWLGAAVGMAVAAVALVPLAVYLAPGTPITTQSVVLPTWFRTVAPHLEGHPVLLVLPAPFSHRESAMTWQAVNTFSYSMVGVGGPGGVAVRAGRQQAGFTVLNNVSASFTGVSIGPRQITAVRQALDAWGVTMVVVPDQADLAPYDRIGSMAVAAALVSAATGQRPVHRSGAWIWGRVPQSGPPVATTAIQFNACTAGVAGGDAVARASACILAPSTVVPTA